MMAHKGHININIDLVANLPSHLTVTMFWMTFCSTKHSNGFHGIKKKKSEFSALQNGNTDIANPSENP